MYKAILYIILWKKICDIITKFIDKIFKHGAIELSRIYSSCNRCFCTRQERSDSVNWRKFSSVLLLQISPLLEYNRLLRIVQIPRSWILHSRRVQLNYPRTKKYVPILLPDMIQERTTMDWIPIDPFRSVLL